MTPTVTRTVVVHVVECPCGRAYQYGARPDPALYLQWYGAHYTHGVTP